jgi:hypothetical protein
MKLNLYLSLLYIAPFMVACSSNDVQETQKENTFSITADLNEEANGRISYSDDEEKINMNWDTNDAIKIFSGDTFTEINSNGMSIDATDSKKAHFTFSSAPTNGDVIRAFIVKDGQTYNSGTVVSDLSKQDGSLANATAKDILYAQKVYKAGEKDYLYFKHEMAIVKFVLNVQGDFTGTLSNITLSGNNLVNQITVTPNKVNTATLHRFTEENSSEAWNSSADEDAITSSGVKGNIVVPSANVTNGKAVVYLCVYPGSLTDAKISFGLNEASIPYRAFKTYTFDLGAKTVEKAKTYVVNTTLIQAHIPDASYSKDYTVSLGNATYSLATPSADWLTCTQSGSTLTVKAEANATTYPRQASVNLQSATGMTKAIVDLSQYEFSDINGTYTWANYGGKRSPGGTWSGTAYTKPVTFELNDAATQTYKLGKVVADMYAICTYKGNYINIKLGQFVGTKAVNSTTYKYGFVAWAGTAAWSGSFYQSGVNYYSNHSELQTDGTIDFNAYIAVSGYTTSLNFSGRTTGTYPYVNGICCYFYNADATSVSSSSVATGVGTSGADWALMPVNFTRTK